MAPNPRLRAMRTMIVAMAARGGAPAIYNHAEFVDVGILMDCGKGIRDAHDRSAEPPSAFAPASAHTAVRLPGVTMPRSETTFAGRVAR
jgi:hypothetical protein